MKIAFLGSKEVGAFALDFLAKKQKEWHINLVAVLTNDRKLDANERGVLDIANQYQLPVKESLDHLLELDIDFIISVQYHQILLQKHIDQAQKLAVNLHMAPLPEYRGCNQFSFAILNNATEFGTTLHEMTAGIDAGNILAEKRFAISNNITVKELHAKTTQLSKVLFAENIAKILHQKLPGIPQKHLAAHRACGFHLRKEIDSIKQIDLSWPEEKIDRHIRATYFPPFPGPYALVNNQKVFLTYQWKSEIKNLKK